MDKKAFAKLLRDPAKIDQPQLNELKKMTRTYPYFQLPYVLLAQHKQNQNTADKDFYLKLAATYVPDRHHLYNILHASSKKTATSSNKKPDQVSETKTKVAKKEPEEQKQKQPDKNKQKEKKNKRLKKDKPRSFFEWLETSEKKEKKEESTLSLPQSEEAKEAFESFRQENTDQPPEGEVKKKASASVSEEDVLVTETLARIHENQGNTSKAIEVYKKLRLKYPEKSRYFARKIKELKSS